MLMKDVGIVSLLNNPEQYFSYPLDTMNNLEGTVVDYNMTTNTTDIDVTGSPKDYYDYACREYVHAFICLPVDQSDRDWVLATEIVLHTIIVLFGIVGNILALIVLNKDKASSSTNTILKALAIWDISNLVLATLNNISRYYISYTMDSKYYDYKTAEILAYLLKWFLIPMKSATTYGSFTMTVMVTVDRYIAVCKPMVVRRKRQVHIVVAILSFYVICFHIPVCFEYQVNTYAGIYAETGINNPIKVIRLNDRDALWGNSAYQLVYRIILATILRDFGPMVLLVVFNAKLYKALKEMRRRYLNMRRGSNMAETKRHSSSSESLTRTVLIVVTVFLVLTLPNLLYELINRTKQIAQSSNNTEIYENLHPVQYNIYFITIAQLLISTASSANFIIYILFARKFRKIFLNTFCKFSCLQGHFEDLTASSSSHQKTNNNNSNLAPPAAKVLPFNITTSNSEEVESEVDNNSKPEFNDLGTSPKKTVSYDNKLEIS